MPRLFNPDGSECLSAEEAMQFWRGHFASLEAGVFVQPEVLVRNCVQEQCQSLGPERIDMRDMPTVQTVEQALRQVQPGRAAGPDGLPTRMCRVFCNSLSLKIWPFVLKTVCRAAESIGHKGGTLFRLVKPGGSPAQCSGSRGVLAQNALAKGYQGPSS